MRDEKRGYEPPAPKILLPKVSKDTIESMRSEFDGMSEGDREIALQNALAEFSEEQPTLREDIDEQMNRIENESGEAAAEEAMAAVLHVYKLLKLQASADDLSKKFDRD